MNELDKVLAILAQQQGRVNQANAGVQQAQRQLQGASAPVNTQFANPGQSFGQVMTDGTGAQRRAMIQMGAEMARDSSRVPGAAMASGFASGFDLLDQIRSRQRQAGMQQAEAGVGAAQQQVDTAIADRQATKGYLDTAAQLRHAFGEKEGKDNRTADIREYEYARQNGFKGSFQDWLDRNKKPDEPKGADPELEQKQLMAAEGTLQTAQITLGSIERAMDQADSWFSTGLWGQMLSGIGGTDAHNLANTLTQIRSTVGFDRLQRMRDESPTGGALGQVSQMELKQLNSALGSLENSQDEDQLKENLQIVKDVYTKILGEMNSYIESKRPKEDDLDALLEQY